MQVVKVASELTQAQNTEISELELKTGLPPEVFELIAEAAVTARRDYLEGIDAKGRPGTDAYNAGIRQLRLSTIPFGWQERVHQGIEMVFNPESNRLLAFQNVHKACSNTDPTAINRKGNAFRELIANSDNRSITYPSQISLLPISQSELANELPATLGEYPEVWLVCVAEHDDRIQVEVSRPRHFEGGCFQGFHERILVADKDLSAIEQAISSIGTLPEDTVIHPEDDPVVRLSKKENGSSKS